MSRIVKICGLLLLLLVGSLASCCNDAPVQVKELRNASVTLLVAPYGLGDNGYNDCIADGVFAFAEQYEVDVRLLLPRDEIEGLEMYTQWLVDNATEDSAVLVLGSSTYEGIAEQTPLSLEGEGSRVLLLESDSEDLPVGIASFMIDRYGASYLVGAMSKDFDALVFAATSEDDILKSAINGFLDGHTANKDINCTSEVIYLAKDESGFAMPDSAYRVIARRMQNYSIYDEVIFPLLGGSGTGVLRCINDNKYSMALLIGMDVDQTGRSSRIPFSMTVHVNNIIYQYLEEWKNGNEWPRKQTLGMKDKAIDIAFTPNFTEQLDIWDDRYEDSETFIKLYEDFYEEALQKETEQGKF